MRLRSLLVPLFLCLALAACDSAEEKAQAHYERGLELLSEGDADRARLEFRNALRQVDTMIEPRLELARLNMKDGALQQAYRDYLRIAEQDPQNAEANIALGQLAFQSKDWEAFERYAPKAVELAPEDPAVRVLDLAARYRAATLAEDQPARAALLAEAEALEQETPDGDILRQILIDGYLAETRFSDALGQVDKAIAARPDALQLHMLKLQILAQMGEEDAVEDQLRKMVSRFPDEETVQANLLRYLVSRDKLDEAEAFLREQVAAAPEGDDTAFVNLVQFLLQLRSQEAAIQELDAAVASRPEAYTLRTLHASLRFDAGEHREAIDTMQGIVDTMSKSEEPLPREEVENVKVTLANMLARDGNEVGARSLVEEILGENPEMIGALKMQARWMILDDDTEGAINAMRLALAKDKQDYEAMTIMAEAFQRAGKHDLMLDFLSQAAEASNNSPEQALRYAAALREDDKLLQAESVLITSLRIQPNDIDILAALGRIYLDLDDMARAQQVADTLEDIDDARARSIASNLKLELFSRQSSSEEMISHLKSLAGQDDPDNGARIALIQAHVQTGETDEALALIDELIAEDPDNLSFVYFRGLVQAQAGDLDAAKETFSDLIQRNPNVVLGWIQLARLHTVGSEPDAVLQILDDGLSANPQSPDLLWAKASFLQEQNDVEGAIAVYEELYKLNSASVVVANNLASLLATFREDQESFERARVIALRLQGTEVPAFQDTYGWILFRSGDTQGALKYLEPAAENLPEDASVQFHLGETYNALGRKEEALEHMRLAMAKIGPLGSGELSEEIRARIEELEAAGTPDTPKEGTAVEN